MEKNPLVLYRHWFTDQYVIWADMIASAAMDHFDTLYNESVRAFGITVDEVYGFLPPDGDNDDVEETYLRGKHSLRLLRYIDQTLAKRNVGITTLIASLLFEITETQCPPVLDESEYQSELDTTRSSYHQALASGDQEGMIIGEDYLDMLEEDREARRFMNETWQSFSQTTFNHHTIATFESI